MTKVLMFFFRLMRYLLKRRQTTYLMDSGAIQLASLTELAIFRLTSTSAPQPCWSWP